MTSRSDHEQYFDAEPSTPSQPATVDLVLPDVSATLATDSGVFGKHRVDPGTKLLLLDGPTATAGDRNLIDLGAGYGPIAVTLAVRNPDAVVWAVEINARARDLCRANAEGAGLKNLSVVAPEDVPDGVEFDRLWSNPPIRIGKPALHSLLARWLDRLTVGGSAHLVVQKHLGSDSLQRWLSENGFQAVRRSSKAGYRLLDVTAAVRTEGDFDQTPSTREESGER